MTPATLAATLLAFCLTTHAGPAEQAQQSAAADVVTTGVGLALGAGTKSQDDM